MKFEITNFETNEVQTIVAKDLPQATKIFYEEYHDRVNWFLTRCIAGHWNVTVSRHFKQWFGIE